MPEMLVQHLLPATVLFVGGHFLLSSLTLRGPLVARLGALGYRGLYSVLALASFAWMLWGYGQMPYIELWGSPPWARWIAAVATFVAAILVVAGYLTPNPSAIGGERVLARRDPAPGIFKVTRHPVMFGTALWAAAHLLANGDLASVVLFGGLFILAAGGIWHMEVRRNAAAAAGDAPGWQRLVALSSVVPFAAVMAGRTHLSFTPADWGRIALGVAVYVALFALHQRAFGVPPLP